ELESLNNDISKLEEIYLTNDDSDEESDNESTDNETYNITSELLVAALKRFQEMKALTQSELSLCFLGIINVSMHTTEFKDGTPKAYLTIKYKFGDIIIPHEISLEQQWYLHDEVAQHIQNPEKHDFY
ncbi:38128_t:CDS:2, partial [Gigaspora margarita]